MPYGWVISQHQNENPLFKPEAISIYVAETEVLASAEDDGTFYFPDLDSGRYTLIAEGKGFMKAMTTDIEVVEDSLTFARVFINDTTEVVYKTSGNFKIREVPLKDRGHIEGYLSLKLSRNEDDGLVDVVMPLEGAIVSLARTAYMAETDSLGYFRIEGVISGMYELGWRYSGVSDSRNDGRSARILYGDPRKINVSKDSTTQILLTPDNTTYELF